MALTPNKRRFVKAVQSGLTGAKAAIQAGYSEKAAKQAGYRLMRDKDVLAALKRQSAGADQDQTLSGAEAEKPVIALPIAQAKVYDDPRAFLFDVLNSINEDVKYKIEAAKALMPYEYAKKGDAGRKGAQEEAAQKAFDFFAPTPPPEMKRTH